MRVNLTPVQRRDLNRQAHNRKVLMQIGKAGLTDAAVEQARRLLDRHQLIKVRISADDRDEARAAAADLAGRVHCDLVGLTGYVAVLYSADAADRLPEPPANADATATGKVGAEE